MNTMAHDSTVKYGIACDISRWWLNCMAKVWKWGDSTALHSRLELDSRYFGKTK
ncbi:hypothetical protein OH492_18200 [Vibrio chagasii]|nr:hypothetical protein [Vibrio chagasii]